jgi:DNA replication protein DnaC
MKNPELEHFWFNVEPMGCTNCVNGWVCNSKDSRESEPCSVCQDKYNLQYKIRRVLMESRIMGKSWEEATIENCVKYINEFDAIRDILNKYTVDSLFIYGSMDKGKTLLLNYMAKKIICAGLQADIYTVDHVQMKLNYSNQNKQEFYDRLIDLDILLLDDFPISSKGWKDENLYAVINERYIQRKKTIVTGNIFPNSGVENESPDYTRIASKINRYYKKIRLI